MTRGRGKPTSPRRSIGRLLLCSAVSIAIGCGDDDGSNGNVDASIDPDASITDSYVYSACSPTTRVGTFRITINEDNAYSSVEGQVSDGIIPTNIPTPVMTVGDCTLVRGRDLFCDPACTTSETCGENGGCIPYPLPHDVGSVDITGLKDPVQMTSRAPAFNYNARGTLQHPLVDESAVVRLSAAGGELSPFSLLAEGVAPMNIDDAPIILEDGNPVTVRWTAPAVSGRSRVLASLNISLHGGNPVRIECDADDTGELTIPAELVSMLLSYGYSGFPAINIVRQTADSAELSVGCVDLRVMALRNRVPVEIPGLISCNDTTPCPMGQVCQMDLTCQ